MKQGLRWVYCTPWLACVVVRGEVVADVQRVSGEADINDQRNSSWAGGINGVPLPGGWSGPKRRRVDAKRWVECELARRGQQASCSEERSGS